jgi:glutamate racemase
MIGVFDSGLGGLSVLAALVDTLPRADFVYFADSAHVPYGNKDETYIQARVLAIGAELIQSGCSLLVVACNTATAVAIKELRHAWPRTPFIGVEPGIKPAITTSPSGRIGVLATPMTLRSAKFKTLIDTHAQGVSLTLQACPGLAAEIEKGALDSTALRELVATFCAPLREAQVDTVVLGCTHYPLIRPLFEAAMPEKVQILDTAGAVARHALRLAQVVHAHGVNAKDTSPELRLWSTGDPLHLQELARRWLRLEDLAAQPL